jgi:ribonuclease HI
VSVLVELHRGASVDSFGTGAWVASLTVGESHKELSGVDSLTTADRVPLIAAIKGLRVLNRRSAVEVYTPSRYLAQGAAKWLPRWKSVMAGKRAVAETGLEITIGGLICTPWRLCTIVSGIS